MSMVKTGKSISPIVIQLEVQLSKAIDELKTI